MEFKTELNKIQHLRNKSYWKMHPTFLWFDVFSFEWKKINVMNLSFEHTKRDKLWWRELWASPWRAPAGRVLPWEQHYSFKLLRRMWTSNSVPHVCAALRLHSSHPPHIFTLCCRLHLSASLPTRKGVCVCMCVGVCTPARVCVCVPQLSFLHTSSNVQALCVSATRWRRRERKMEGQPPTLSLTTDAALLCLLPPLLSSGSPHYLSCVCKTCDRDHLARAGHNIL